MKNVGHKFSSGFQLASDLLKVAVGDRGPSVIFPCRRTLKLGSLLYSSFIVHIDPWSKNKHFDSSSMKLRILHAVKKIYILYVFKIPEEITFGKHKFDF